MKRTHLVGLTIATLLISVPPASGKEITAAKVCGADGCTEIRDRALLGTLPEGGDPTDPPAKAALWYTMTLSVQAEDAHDRFTVAVVPSLNLMRGSEGTWMPMGGAPARALSRITSRHEPFPAADLKGVGPAAPPKVRVVEVVEPPAARAGGASWPWLAGAVAALGALSAGALLLLRRRPLGHWLRRGAGAGDADGHVPAGPHGIDP